MKKPKRNQDTKDVKHYFMSSYIVIISLFSVMLFLNGFFSLDHNDGSIATRNDIPQFVNRTRIKLEEVYKPVVKKLVIMVIDAIRWDFVSGPNSSDYMPITTSLLMKSAGCVYKTRVKPPTVTMPRIKAMTTGTVPNFFDVVLNVGANEVFGDSILRQVKSHGHKTIFYGDDTWLKLFPKMFHRYEGTNSFFVSDYTEVDNNVTRNVEVELEKTDWSIMILHYLGLDHIGHVYGPFSSLVKPKLREMDKIIGTIASYLSEMNKNGEQTLFLICGDHGMKNSGGHGGATLEETLVPLVAFGQSCKSKQGNHEISQTDIAPTLSVLLGVPIPSTNLGSIILELVENLSDSQKLFVLFYNAQQLFLRYQKLSDYQYTDAFKNYQNAIKLHTAWLSTSNHPNDMVQDIFAMYESASIEMKNALTSSLVRYDVHFMSLATIFLGQIMYICISTKRITFKSNYRLFFANFLTSYVFWIFLNQILDSEIKTFLFSQKLDLKFLYSAIPLLGILVLNCYLCSSSTLSLDMWKNLTLLQILLSGGTILHALSFSSSSFVEEEHQTWYFFWITIMMFFTYDVLTKSFKKLSSKLAVLLLITIISHRILRKMNSTGDQYAHLPDVSDWLQDQESNFYMTSLLISSLILLVGLDLYLEVDRNKLFLFILDGIIAILIYLRHAATDTVFRPDFYVDSRGIIVIKCFWILILIYLGYSIYRLSKAIRNNKPNALALLLLIVLKKWAIVSCVLHRPHNVILVPAQLIAGITIHEITKDEKYDKIKLPLYLWCGSAFYFMQGNSNSIATVDVAAGYIGLESYQPAITLLFLFINTYSAHILSFLMSLYSHLLQNPLLASNDILTLCMQYAFWRLVPMAFYAIIISFQRYHLFVWTVFSPKLLYETIHCIVLFSVMFLLQLLLGLHDWIKIHTKLC